MIITVAIGLFRVKPLYADLKLYNLNYYVYSILWSRR